MTPRVSVIIPVYERQKELEKALMSVIRQEGLEAGMVETIIVDDASPTPTRVDPLGHAP